MGDPAEPHRAERMTWSSARRSPAGRPICRRRNRSSDRSSTTCRSRAVDREQRCHGDFLRRLARAAARAERSSVPAAAGDSASERSSVAAPPLRQHGRVPELRGRRISAARSADAIEDRRFRWARFIRTIPVDAAGGARTHASADAHSRSASMVAQRPRNAGRAISRDCGAAACARSTSRSTRFRRCLAAPMAVAGAQRRGSRADLQNYRAAADGDGEDHRRRSGSGCSDWIAISVEENFFDLGGHSLLMVQMHRQLREALKREFPIVTLVRASDGACAGAASR